MFQGLLDSGYLYQRFDEDIHEGMRLGRHQWLDGRSLAYMVENDVRAMSTAFTSQRWDRRIPILDQGDVGACTAFAGTGTLGSEPFVGAGGKNALPALDDVQGLQDFALKLYSDATKVDGYPGDFPREDTGSSGLAICKVLRSRGIIPGYRWARSPYGLLTLLQRGPVLQGMPWYRSFFDPDSQGFIDADPGWEASGSAGGHEVEVVGVELDTRDAFDSVLLYANSWGANWGDQGYFRMRLRTLERLTSVDLKQFTLSS